MKKRKFLRSFGYFDEFSVNQAILEAELFFKRCLPSFSCTFMDISKSKSSN
jgi:hypothetical protein